MGKAEFINKSIFNMINILAEGKSIRRRHITPHIQYFIGECSGYLYEQHSSVKSGYVKSYLYVNELCDECDFEEVPENEVYKR